MRVLTVSERTFTGKTKGFALKSLSEWLAGASDDDLEGLEIMVGYKELRTLKFTDGQWVIEICENGVGEVRQYLSKQEALSCFAGFASEKGDHWD
jgi:hypothetical protein